MYGKRKGGPWYGEDFRRIIFERNIGKCFSDISIRTIKSKHNAGREYQLTVQVPYYGEYRVQILFKKDSPRTPRVTVEGFDNLKHRFPEGNLCMWYPDDPTANRWTFEDGLVSLIGYIIIHLFREAWYKETGEWLGPEVDHIKTEQN